MCFQYAINCKTGDCSDITDISGGGAMVPADDDGNCGPTIKYNVSNVNGLTSPPSFVYSWDPRYVPGNTNTATHKLVPVTNEKCLYNLWMCSCWANQADGCLCAFENPDQESVTVIKK